MSCCVKPPGCMCMCKENEKWLHFQFQPKFEMTENRCEKCDDELYYCEDCQNKSDEVFVKDAAKKRQEANQEHWETFLRLLDMIDKRRQGLLEIDMLTEAQTKKAIALLEAAGFAAARRFAVVESVRYAVIEYVAK